jgi:hypothetical protein
MRQKGLWAAILMIIIAVTGAKPALAGDETVILGKELDRVIATVDGEPVLRSDIMLEMDLGLLSSGNDDPEFEELVDPYLNRLMIIREVEELGGYRLPPGQAENSYIGYRASFESREHYRKKLAAWGVTDEEVKARLKRALLVSLYTESRIQFFINILPSDIEEAYNREPEKWGGRSVYEVWDEINSVLESEAFAREQERWMETLRARYRLEILGKSSNGNGDHPGNN